MDDLHRQIAEAQKAQRNQKISKGTVAVVAGVTTPKEIDFLRREGYNLIVIDQSGCQ